MKILIIANYTTGSGGISIVVYNLLNKIREEGFLADIFNTKKNNLNRIFLIFPLIMKAKKYDIIHIHGCSYSGFFPIVLGVFVSKFLYNKKTIVTYHGGGGKQFLRKYHKFIKGVLVKANHVTVMSEFLKNAFEEYGIRTVILPNIIEIEINKNNSDDFSKPKIVSIRSLSKIYNIDSIIKSFGLIKSKYSNAELKIIGDGPNFNKLVKFCKTEGLTDVNFLGKLPNEQIPDELIKSNIMVTVPSFDNQPLSILEAFASGIPVISSRVGGIPYIIQDNVNGFLVDVNSPFQIFEKVDWIMNNPDKTKSIIRNAKNELERYHWSNIRKILFDLYVN